MASKRSGVARIISEQGRSAREKWAIVPCRHPEKIRRFLQQNRKSAVNSSAEESFARFGDDIFLDVNPALRPPVGRRRGLRLARADCNSEKPRLDDVRPVGCAQNVSPRWRIHSLPSWIKFAKLGCRVPQ